MTVERVQQDISMPGMPSAITRSLVCVDAAGNRDYAGKLYNLYMAEPLPFGQIKDLVFALDRFFSDLGYPQSSFQHRSFFAAKPELEPANSVFPPRCHEEDLFERHRGELATFELEVRFRQNATWQGGLTWVDQNEYASFRSVLAMIRLLDGALRLGRLAP